MFECESKASKEKLKDLCKETGKLMETGQQILLSDLGLFLGSLGGEYLPHQGCGSGGGLLGLSAGVPL